MEVEMTCGKKAKWLTFGLADEGREETVHVVEAGDCKEAVEGLAEALMVTFGMSEGEAWGVIGEVARHHVGGSL